MRIGVLGNEGSWYVERLCSAAVARGHFVTELRFPDQAPAIIGGTTALRIGEANAGNLDAIVVRTMPPGSLEQVVTRMNFLAVTAQQGVDVVNPPKAIECAVDKYLTTQLLAMAGLPVPDTIVCENADTALEAFETLGSDVVVKPLFGAEGRGILRVDHPEMALRVFRTLERLDSVIYLQKFNDGPREDIRVLLLDGEVIGSIKRRATGDDFRANIAQAGTAQPWSPSDTEVKLSQAAADATGCLFCGVDIMYSPEGNPLVIEVNAVPGWRALEKVTNINVADRFIKWLESRKQ